MASLGHGISEAVRAHIPIWVDESLIDTLYVEYQKGGGILKKDGYGNFRHRIRQSAEWVRKSRKNTSSGFERLYHCKTVKKATLIVHSPASDMSANSYVFCVDGKPVAGGKTKLKSTQVSQELSKKDKTSTKLQDVHFIKFTEEQLRKMRTEMEFGDGFQFLELERIE